PRRQWGGGCFYCLAVARSATALAERAPALLAPSLALAFGQREIWKTHREQTDPPRPRTRVHLLAPVSGLRQGFRAIADSVRSSAQGPEPMSRTWRIECPYAVW